MSVHPVSMHLKQGEGALELKWSDGQVDIFALSYLRGWCPCAHCQGHFAEQKVFVRDANAVLVDVQPVGGYAVSFRWGDRHRTGIYTYSYLRELAKAPPGQGPSNLECFAAMFVAQASCGSHGSHGSHGGGCNHD
jgi:DUF971 family protein